MSILAEYFEKIRRMNWLMTLAIACLLAIGVCFIFSARHVIEERSTLMPKYMVQILWAALGACVYVALAVADYRATGRFSWWFYGISLLLLVAVLIPGVGIKITAQSAGSGSSVSNSSPRSWRNLQRCLFSRQCLRLPAII